MEEEYNSSDPEFVEKAEELERMWADQDRIDLEDVLNTRQGRNAIWRIMALCEIFGPIPTDNDILRNLGKRDIGLALQQWVFTSDDKAYSLMQIEAFKREEQRKEYLDG